MKEKHHWNLWFYLPASLYLLMGAAVLLFVDKGHDVIFVNKYHSSLFDNFFYYGTELGNGVLYVLFIVALMWFSFRKAAVAMMCFSATGLLVQFFKRIVFSDVTRPSVLLKEIDLHFVEGVSILSHFSFPSGHAALAFSLFCFLSQIIQPRHWGLFFFILALIGGMSRVYLVQHFFIDVYFGALLGIGVTSIIWWLAEQAHWITTSKWGDGSIRSMLRR